MVKVSYDQKPYPPLDDADLGRRGVRQPPSNTRRRPRHPGRRPGQPGLLGIAISEAVEEAGADPGTNYALGSVLNHVLLHQTVIGLEAKKQFEKIGEYPDMIFAPCGGGSNFAGIAFPFLADKAAGDKRAKNLRWSPSSPSPARR
jgi:tryptophan synthase beta chain